MPRMSQYLKTPQGLRGVVQNATAETIPDEQEDEAAYQPVDQAIKPPKKKPGKPSISAMIASMKRRK